MKKFAFSLRTLVIRAAASFSALTMIASSTAGPAAVQPQAASTSISQNATGVWLGNPQNPPPNPAVIANTATVTAAGNVGTPTGSVRFTLYPYPDATCGGPPVYQSSSLPLLNGSATIQVPVEQVGAGSFYWIVSYTSDQPAQYSNSSSSCGAAISNISRASPVLSVQTSKFTATLGETDDVKATVTGGYRPVGPVTFYASGPNDLTCSQRTALATLTVGSDATVTYSFQPTQPGTYVLTASFARDSFNEAASTSCGDDGKVTFIPPGPQPAVSFTVTAPPNVYVGQAFAFTVTAYDAYSNVAIGYNGKVHFTSSNGAGLPADSMLVNGRAIFQATVNANGSQTITATDTSNSSVTGTTNLFAYPQSTFVVTSTGDSDNGTCGSVCTLRDAINAANNQAGPATITFNIPNMAGCTAANQCTVTLGGTLPAVSDDVAINGSANNAQITVEGSFHRILMVNSGKRATMTALTLQGGSVGAPSSSGGAIHNDGTLYLSGMNFRNNATSNVSGGAIGNGNTGTLDVTGCSFSNNVATNNSGHGGAIYNQGNLTIRQSTFDSNTSRDAYGGAIRHEGASMTISDSTFTNNQAPSAYGGAISKTGSGTITTSTFMNNSTGGGGGAIQTNGPTTLANCTFYANSAQGDGAGRGGSAFFCIVSGSILQRITNCTFIGNVSGPNSSGAITNYASPGDVILRNVLLSNNTRGNCGGDASINADSSNMSDDATCGSATVKTLGEINPGFPADNGGPTKTIALYPNSAPIDAGNDALCKAAVGPPAYGAGGTDQRGVPRPQGSHCDVGAYEVMDTLAPPTVSAPSYDNSVNSGPVNLYTLTNASAPPSGGGSNFSGQGVTGNNGAVYYFDPTGIPIGTVVTITYQIYDIFNHTNSVTFTVRVTEAPSLVVTTNGDSTTPVDGLTSLREALVYAQSLGGARTITFAPGLAGHTIALTQGELVVPGNVTFDGSAAAGVTISGGGSTRILRIAPGGIALVKSLTLANGSSSGGANGGAIYHNGTSLTLQNSTFRDNQAVGGAYGGAVSADSGNLSITGCTFSNNGATGGNGGAIVNFGTQLTIINSTFSGNSAVNGGAILSYANTTTLTHCTIVNNAASFTGGGVERVGRPGNSVSLQNTLVAANTASQAGPDVYSYNDQNNGAFTTLGNNLIGNGTGNIGLTNGSNGDQVGTGATPINANIGPLQDNGGPTATIALQPGSLAIDAGVAIAGLTTDQRGTARPQADAPDVGAFELVPTQAAIPIISPLSGAYQDMVQIGITSTSTNSTVRYTVDGSTPSSTTGQVYSGPLTFTHDATVKAIAFGRGWLDSPVASANYNVLTALPYWRNLQGLAADGSQDLANPSRDGVPNLLKYAFNLAPNAGDLARSNAITLAPGGTAGLPRVGYDGQGRLIIEFVRRKAATTSGIAYIVESGPDLLNWSSLGLTNASVTSIDGTWERVRVTDPNVATKRFGRVRVVPFDVYFNDFNAGLGAATLRGTASYANQAVQLTDTVEGQNGAVIFNGINLTPQVTGFTARFNLQLGPTTTGIPADGASFVVGDLGSTAWGESGPGTAHNIVVGFDTYDNGDAAGNIGIHLFVNGVHVAVNATNPYTNGALVPVEVGYDAASGVTVKFNGTTIFNNAAITGFTFQTTDKFGISARTGGANERAVVDDVQITPR